MARTSEAGTQQAIQINSQDAVEAAVLDLIGDLAAYRPYAKIVLVEGHKETRFDVDMIRRLFPDLAEKGNFIPVGNRRMTSGVRIRLLEVLSEAGLTGRAVSISDNDLGLSTTTAEGKAGHFTWSVYEIENFLLVPSVLRGAAELLLRNDPFDSDEEVINTLRNLAAGLVEELACDEVQNALNQEFVKSLSIGGAKKDPIRGLKESAAASKERVWAVDISGDRVDQMFAQSSTRFHEHLKSTEFLLRFPGDRLLRALAGRFGITGDHYRNACLDQAQRQGLRPKAMERTLLDALA